MDFIDVRVWFTKKGDIKFISHLDLNRFMQRALKRAKLPLWHTEGFNPHPYVTFALPLSLGQESECEMVDFRLIRPMPFEEIKEALQSVFPQGMQVLNVASPVKKAKEIAWTQYMLRFPEFSLNKDQLADVFCRDSILVTKRTKKGGEAIVDLAPHLKDVSIRVDGGYVCAELKMPAGSTLNLNPSLLVGAVQKEYGLDELPCHILRTAVYTEKMESFS